MDTYLPRWSMNGSMHTTASALVCSLPNSSRVRTSNSRTLKFGLYFHSYSVFGNNVLKGSSAFSAVGVMGGIIGDLGALVLKFEL